MKPQQVADPVVIRDPARLFAVPAVNVLRREDGALLLNSPQPLKPYPRDLELARGFQPPFTAHAGRRTPGTARPKSRPIAAMPLP
jgi:hypothetical protein